MFDQELKLVLKAVDKTKGAFDNVNSRMKTFGKKTKALGKSLTTKLSLPIAGVAAMASKWALDFEDAAAKVASTADLTSEDLESLKTGVEDIAVATGQATNDIFSAMQKAVSGSLDLAESQKLVEQTTKAAASGFGENERLVDVATTAYDLFSDKASSASEILDQLVAGAQATQVNVEDMAGAFSRVSSVGSSLNINQRDLIATLGVVSERMGDTQRGGRAFAQSLRVMQKPTKEADGIITDLFGSTDKLQKAIQEDFIGTLSLLKLKLGDANLGLEDVFASSQSLDSMQMALSDSGERVKEVMDKVSNSAGAVDDAFEKSESASRKLRRIWQKLKKELRPLGDMIIDYIVPALEKLVDWISNLSDKQKKWIVIIGLLIAAIGPLLMILGTLSLVIGAISPIVVAVIAVIAGLVAAIWSIYNNVKELIPVLKVAWSKIKDVFFAGVEKVKKVLQPLFDFIEKIIGMARSIGSSVKSAVGGALGKAGDLIGLADGGIVTKPTLAMVGEAGPEAVIPLSKTKSVNGGKGITVNIYGGNFLSEDVAEELSDEIINKLKLQQRL